MAQGFSERVRWSRKTWSLDELVLSFGNQFPIIVNTTSGFYGANEVEYISAGEVLRVHSLVTQRRLFARDDVRGRIYSLPLNLTTKFETLKENGRTSRPKRLDEILDDSELPTRVALAASENASFIVGETRYDNEKLGNLTLYKIYEEAFIRVNSVARGAIDKNVMLLPLYVQIEVRLAKGFKDGQREDWDSLLQMYDRSVGQSKITTINGLDDILVYDPTDDSLVNPQAIAISTLKDVRSSSMLLKDSESGKGRDSLISRLSAFKISGKNKDGKRMAKSFTEYRDNTANILRYGNRNSSLAMPDLQEDKFAYSVPPEVSTWSRKRKQDTKPGHIQKSRPPKITISPPADEIIHMEHEFNQMTVFDKEDGDERSRRKGQANVEMRDRKVLESVSEEIRLEKNHSDIQSSRPQPLERPILAKRTSVPTGRVSPMVKVSANTTRTAAIVLNPADEVNQTEGRTNEDIIQVTSALRSPSKQQERQPKAASDTEVWEQLQGPFSDSEVIDMRRLDDKRARLRISQSTEEFDDTLNRPPSKSKKKSALKAGQRRRSTRAKRHVSYSDTDTVYPLDSSHDDMAAADDSELDSPFYSSNAPTVHAGNWRSQSMIGHSRSLHTPLPTNRRRQTGNLVVNVHPVTSLRKKNSPPMAREHFHGSDSFARSPAASFRYPTSIGVIPEAMEEYQTGSTSRQYDLAASRVRIGDLDAQRKYGSSVINVGGLTSSRKQFMEPAIINVGDNSSSFSTQIDASSRRRTDSRAAASSNRKPGFEWKHDANSTGRRRNQKMLAPISPTQKRNGLTTSPPSDYGGQALYNLTTHPFRTAEYQRNFAGKVIRLNETKDGKMWDEIISDYEADKLDPYSRLGTMAQSGRPTDSNYLIHAATMSRVRDTGTDYSSSPSLGKGRNHLTHLSTSGLVSTLAVNNSDRGRGGLQGRAPSGYNREGFASETMPRIYRDNQNVIRKIGVVAPNVVLVRK